MEKVHGEVVPAHVVVPPFTKVPVHPENTEPALGVAVYGSGSVVIDVV